MKKQKARKPLTISARSKVGRAVMEEMKLGNAENCPCGLCELVRLARRAGWGKKR